MTQRARIEVTADDAGALPGFALKDDRAGRFVAASLRSSVESGFGRGTAVERRPWGNVVWRQLEEGHPTVSCVAVIAPGLTGPRRLLARGGLPSPVVHGVAGCRFASPLPLDALAVAVMILAAVVVCSGGSKIWPGAVVAAIASAAWAGVGATIGARSGYVRRVVDPAHLAVLGRIEESLRTLRGSRGDTGGVASTVEESWWWAAAASRPAASSLAEDLEVLVRRQRQDTAKPCRSISDLWDSYYRVVEEHSLYETDIEKILAAPQLTDLAHPATAAFVTALLEAQDVLEDLGRGAMKADDVAAALHRLELLWHAAQQSAEQARLSGFAADEQKALRRAAELIKHALHDSSSPAERQDCYQNAMRLLDGLIDVPAHLEQAPLPALEKREDR